MGLPVTLKSTPVTFDQFLKICLFRDHCSQCTEKYPSYADCDDDFILRSLPPGLTPFWSLDNSSLASNNFTLKEDFRTENIIDKLKYFLYN